MEKTKTKAVEMTRRIRDAHYEQLKNKSREDRIAFYRDKARRLQELLQARLQEQPTSEQ